uniref:Uncharacterized protein n=1 Tax=Buteo japonicus TaxID=224669 RepID=A0A8C0HRH6_9AVES
MCIILLPSRVVNTNDGPRALTLEDYLNGNFQYKTFFPYWVSDNEYLHQSTEDDIILYNVEMNYPTTIMTNSTMVRTFSINKKAAKCSCVSSTSLKVSGLKPDSSNPYLEGFFTRI